MNLIDRELERIVTIAEASHITSLSHDTLRREYAHLIKKLSPRRAGIRLRDVLAIGEARTDTP